MRRVLLYITTQKNDLDKEETELYVSTSDSDGEAPLPIRLGEPDEVRSEDSSVIMRRELIAQQDQAYKETLEADVAKEQNKRLQLLAELTTAERQEDLMDSRLARVPEEPFEGEDKVDLHVRHPTLGTVKRSFGAACKMNAV